MFSTIKILTISLSLVVGSSFVTRVFASSEACIQEAAEFVSDSCTSLNQYDRVTGASYVKCCFIHDIAYYKGGSEKRGNGSIFPAGAASPTDKENADNEFAKCIKNAICLKDPSRCKSKIPFVGSHAERTAWTMLQAVKLLGDTSGNCLHNDDWQWGYGWKKTKGCSCRHEPNFSQIDGKLHKALRVAEGTDAEIAQWIKKQLPKKTQFPRAKVISDLDQVINQGK